MTAEDDNFFPREKEELPRAGLVPRSRQTLYQLSHQLRQLSWVDRIFKVYTRQIYMYNQL